MDSLLKSYLSKHNLYYIEYKHPPVSSVEESKSLKVKVPGMHCKTLFLKDDKGKFYLIGMKADKRLNTSALKKVLNAKKLNFASPTELKEVLNLAPGSVSIFGIINSKNTSLIIDEDVWSADLVGFHPNLNTSTLVLNHENLEKFYNSLNAEKQIIKL